MYRKNIKICVKSSIRSKMIVKKAQEEVIIKAAEISSLNEIIEELKKEFTAFKTTRDKTASTLTFSDTSNVMPNISFNKMNLKPLNFDKFDEYLTAIKETYEPMFEQYNKILESSGEKKIPFENKEPENNFKASQNSLVTKKDNHDETLKRNKAEIADKENIISEYKSTVTEQKKNISTLNNQIKILKSEIEDGKNQIESLKISNSLPSQENINPKHADLITELVKLQDLLQKSYENNQSLREFMNRFSQNTQMYNLDLSKSNIQSVDQVKNKIISEKEMNSLEETIKDSLATLRNLSKFFKMFENIDDKPDKVKKSEIANNILKVKKTIKILHKNQLKIYRVL